MEALVFQSRYLYWGHFWIRICSRFLESHVQENTDLKSQTMEIITTINLKAYFCFSTLGQSRYPNPEELKFAQRLSGRWRRYKMLSLLLNIFAEFHGAEARSSAEALCDCISSKLIKNQRLGFPSYNKQVVFIIFIRLFRLEQPRRNVCSFLLRQIVCEWWTNKRR